MPIFPIDRESIVERGWDRICANGEFHRWLSNGRIGLRAMNCIAFAQIDSLSKLRRMTKKKWLAVPGCGDKTIAELVAASRLPLRIERIGANG